VVQRQAGEAQLVDIDIVDAANGILCAGTLVVVAPSE
jgi:hypothetical protein